MFPSTTTASSLVIAPVSFSSNPGWQVACLPSNNPAAPKTLGAAQIAATIFPSPANFLITLLTMSLAPRFKVPGIPPGRTIASNPSKSTSDASASVKNVTLWELVTSFLSVIEMVVISNFALRTISTTVSPSISSHPSAIKIPTFFMPFILHFVCVKTIFFAENNLLLSNHRTLFLRFLNIICPHLL